MASTTTTAEERLIEKYIEIDPRRRSADWARIKRHGMNVWALIGALGGDESALAIAEVARGYGVPAVVVHAALAYYRRNKPCIDVILRANSGERVELGDDPLVLKYIQIDPDWDSEDDARIMGHGVQVWALIGALDGNESDVEEVARDYRIPLEAMEAALAYYRSHKDAIDCRLAAHRA
jgi:uncharacterized protein (DUF433 family)